MTRMKLDKFCLVAAIAALLALIFPLSGIDSDTGKQVAFVGDIPGLAIVRLSPGLVCDRSRPGWLFLRLPCLAAGRR